jgi:hypothetical protein
LQYNWLQIKPNYASHADSTPNRRDALTCDHASNWQVQILSARHMSHGEELGQHRLADLIDPVRVLDHKDRWFGAGQRHGIDQRRQPPPPRIRIDLRQLHIGIGDAQQAFAQLMQDDLAGAVTHFGAVRDEAEPAHFDILKPASLQGLGFALAYQGEVRLAQAAGQAVLEGAAELGEYFLGMGYWV